MILLFQPNKQIKSYDKRALWGWDNDNFAKGNSDGIVEIDGVVFGIRICFEIRFPEFFREFYKRNTDRRSAGFLCGSWRGFPFWL